MKKRLPEWFKFLLQEKLYGDWLDIDNDDYETKIDAILDVLSGMTMVGDDDLKNAWREVEDEVSINDVERYLRWVAFDEGEEEEF